MHIEITQAVEFLGRLLQSKVEADAVQAFKTSLSELLAIRFQDHWDPQQPYRGNGYRAISNFDGQLDPLLITASVNANLQPNSICNHLPSNMVVWTDPFSVSYRVGDHGNIMTLFEDKSRGRISMKMASSSPTITNNRTSTPIRISPPNSPETVMLFKPNNNNNKKGVVLAN